MPASREALPPVPSSDDGARAILRVPAVLMEIAARRGGSTLAELVTRLQIPKASLHRLLRTLERGGYLVHEGGSYRLGANSIHLASLIHQAAPAQPFPACARPELEALAAATGETILLGVLSEERDEIVYVDVIDSQAMVRFTLQRGDRPPLFSAAAGKAALAFLPAVKCRHYLENAAFTRFTPYTTTRAQMPAQLAEIRTSAVAFDGEGRALGAGAVASPIFAAMTVAGGEVLGAVAVAGPIDRIIAERPRFESLVRAAAERISRVAGFTAPYPPAPLDD